MINHGLVVYTYYCPRSHNNGYTNGYQWLTTAGEQPLNKWTTEVLRAVDEVLGSWLPAAMAPEPFHEPRITSWEPFASQQKDHQLPW